MERGKLHFLPYLSTEVILYMMKFNFVKNGVSTTHLFGNKIYLQDRYTKTIFCMVCIFNKTQCTVSLPLAVSSVHCVIFDILVYIYLTTIGLTHGGSSTAHIYTQTIHRIQRMEHT
jgi:hypothetical protein